jgi:nitrogen regulatory protein PII
MYHMVLLVLNNPDQCPSVLDAWDALGVGGITILESTGLGHLRAKGIRDDLPLMPSLVDLLRSREERHRTLFTVVEDEAQVDRIIEATQKIVGDLEQPHNGVLFILPVSRVVGLRGGKRRAQKDPK